MVCMFDREFALSLAYEFIGAVALVPYLVAAALVVSVHTFSVASGACCQNPYAWFVDGCSVLWFLIHASLVGQSLLFALCGPMQFAQVVSW